MWSAASEKPETFNFQFSFPAMLLQRIFALFLFSLFSVLFSAEVSSEVFKPVGSSVQLDVQQHEYKYEEFIWMFNDVKIVKYYINSKEVTYDPFKGRVEFNKTTHSLTLMNLQESDSGLYRAIASGQKDKTVAEYTLSVLGPVETLDLTAVPDHLSTDSDPCNITLTCRGHNLSINSSCYNETCEEKKMTPPGNITLFLSVRDSSSIICNISNPVSWKTRAMNMSNLKQLCHRKDHMQSDSKNWQTWLIPAVISAVAITVVGVVVVRPIMMKSKTKSTGKPEGDTVYAEVENGREVPAVALGELESPSTVYSTVGCPALSSENQESNGTTPGTLRQSQRRVLPLFRGAQAPINLIPAP
ncbi:uncharacterized protein LOC143482615 isoform X2 [Brachyhypopomus gauderio]|uniref:uncharacterized protein LOC143482615 isoform X2 n=1 Tax=Brachyhypopomus gauderio TaxID=698409 RepID=UPI0040436277